jgi:TnpA family transposase
LRPETFADALGRIVDAHHGLSFAQHWGAAEHSSSDGQFFSANRGSGVINAKYGPDPGLKIYSFLSGQYGSFHSSIIGATAGEAPFVLDGLLSNPASFDPLVHYPPFRDIAAQYTVGQWIPAACRTMFLLSSIYWG